MSTELSASSASLARSLKFLHLAAEAVRAAIEPLECRLLLAGTPILASDYFPRPGLHLNYSGGFAQLISSFDALEGVQPLPSATPASAGATTTSASGYSASATEFDDVIAYETASGILTPYHELWIFALDSNGLQLCADPDNLVSAGSPMHLLNSVANVGDVYPFTNGSVTVQDLQAIAISGGQTISAVKLVIQKSADNRFSSGEPGSFTNWDYGDNISDDTITLVLAPGLGIVDFSEAHQEADQLTMGFHWFSSTGTSFRNKNDQFTLASASDTVSISNGTVVVTGSSASDTIAGGVDPLDSSQFYFRVQSAGEPLVERVLPRSQVTALQIYCDPSWATPTPANNDLVNLGGDNFGFPVTISGGTGSDTLIGQEAFNYVTTAPGSQRSLVFGGISNDVIQSQGANDTLYSGGGGDIIAANSGNNLLYGGPDGSQLFAGRGYDTLIAGRGNSILNGSGQGSLLIGGLRKDTLNGGNGNDTIIAGSGHSQIAGGAGDDFLDAGWDAYLILQGGASLPAASGSDSVDGSAGISDTLVASSGTPTLVGGTGNNDFDVNDSSATLQNVNSGNFVAEDDTVSSVTQTITINLTIQIVTASGTTDVQIPGGAGAAASGTSAAEATNASGQITFQSNGSRSFTLADFFNHWGVDFNSLGVGQFVATPGSGHSLSMTVNGLTNTEFNYYQVQNSDNIVITFAN